MGRVSKAAPSGSEGWTLPTTTGATPTENRRLRRRLTSTCRLCHQRRRRRGKRSRRPARERPPCACAAANSRLWSTCSNTSTHASLHACLCTGAATSWTGRGTRRPASNRFPTTATWSVRPRPQCTACVRRASSSTMEGTTTRATRASTRRTFLHTASKPATLLCLLPHGLPSSKTCCTQSTAFPGQARCTMPTSPASSCHRPPSRSTTLSKPKPRTPNRGLPSCRRARRVPCRCPAARQGCQLPRRRSAPPTKSSPHTSAPLHHVGLNARRSRRNRLRGCGHGLTKHTGEGCDPIPLRLTSFHLPSHSS
eukprot:Rhum_TRINITY_DN10498_c0_g1::Rhum_TRINITY_DN10498_c0_g1_i1::g.38680::m.38680